MCEDEEDEVADIVVSENNRNNHWLSILRAIVRPIITLAFTGVMCYLALRGGAPPEWFLSVAVMVVTWWFKERSEK